MIERDYIHERVKARILEMIRSGQWAGSLPSERHLAAELKVSRRAVRDALTGIEADGVIARRGKRNREVVRKPSTRRKKQATVGISFMGELYNERPSLAYTAQLVREILMEQGIHVVLHEGSHERAARTSDEYFKELVLANRYDCWLVNDANLERQRFLQDMKIPCVLVGSPHEGIELPYVTIDDQATFLHAVNLMTHKGHRKILYSGISRQGSAWTQFSEVIKRYRADYADLKVTEVPAPLVNKLQSWVNACSRRLKPENGYTCYFVGNPFHYIPLTQALEKAGRRVPESFSIVSRYDDRFLHYSLPTPTRYTLDPHKISRTYVRQVRQVLSGRTPPVQGMTIVPELTRGKTLGSPPDFGDEARRSS